MVNVAFPPEVYRGLTCMAEGAYFEAHEWLEEAWRATRDPIRELYQGLLQAAVVAYHVQQGNLQGAKKVCVRALRHLRPWPEVVGGLQVGHLRAQLQQLCQEVEEALQGRPPARWSYPVPVWRASDTKTSP